MARARGTRRTARLRVYLDEGRAKPPVFQITPALWRAAARRHPAVARHLTPVFRPNYDDLDAVIDDIDIIVGFRFPTGVIRARGANLKLLHATGAGVDHLLPLDWLPPGAVLTNNRGVHAAKIKGSAMMAILALNGALPRLVSPQRRAEWRQLFTTAVAGKTLLVVGVGSMGGATAAAGRALGMRVLGIRRGGRPHRSVHAMYRPRELARLAGRADFIIATAPHTPETHHMVDRRVLDRMKPSAGLINCGRAGLVDYAALARKLERGEIAGALLDVFDPEPLPASSPLWATPNLIMTPHVTSDDAVSYMPLTLDLVFDNIARLLAGRTLRNRVRADRGY